MTGNKKFLESEEYKFDITNFNESTSLKNINYEYKRLDWFFRSFRFIDCIFLNLANKLQTESLIYILLNIIGAGVACFAAVLIHFIPFIILEGCWTLVSILALIKFYAKKTQ